MCIISVNHMLFKIMDIYYKLRYLTLHYCSNVCNSHIFPDMSSFKATPPQKIRVKAGHHVIFELPPVESVPTPSVTWQTEDNALLYGTKYAVTSNNKQIILSVDSSDQKRYR